MSDNIVGIDGGKKDKKKDYSTKFKFFYKDGNVETYEGGFIATNSALEGFIQVVPADEKDQSLILIRGDIINKIISEDGE